MPSPRLGSLASWLIARMASTPQCEKQHEECRASEGKIPSPRGVIHGPGRNEVPGRGRNGHKPDSYCRCCGPDSCCADCPPAEPSLRVACLKKPVARSGNQVSQDERLPTLESASRLPVARPKTCSGVVPSRDPGGRGTIGCFSQALFIPWSSSQVLLAAGHFPISPGPGRDAPEVSGGWKVLS